MSVQQLFWRLVIQKKYNKRPQDGHVGGQQISPRALILELVLLHGNYRKRRTWGLWGTVKVLTISDHFNSPIPDLAKRFLTFIIILNPCVLNFYVMETFSSTCESAFFFF